MYPLILGNSIFLGDSLDCPCSRFAILRWSACKDSACSLCVEPFYGFCGPGGRVDPLLLLGCC